VRGQLLQCVGVFAQPTHSVDGHRAMPHGERCQLAERGIQLLILTALVGLNQENLFVKYTFNKILKFSRLLKNFRLLF
jgi:hypothetical protein